MSLEDYIGQPPELSANQKKLGNIELEQQQQLLDTGKDSTQNLFNPTGGFNAGTNFTDLDAVVGFNQDQLAAQTAGRTAAGQAGQMNPELLKALQFGLGGVMDIENNPYAQGAIRSAVDPVMDQIMERIIPGAKSAAIQQGAYGGSRDGLFTAQAVDDAAQGARRSADTLAAEFYGQGVDSFNKTLAGAPSTINALMQPSDMLKQVGDTIAERDNILRSQDIARHDFERDMPFQRAEQYAGILDTLYEKPSLLNESFAQDGGDQGIGGDLLTVLGLFDSLGIAIGGEGTNITIENALDSVIEGGNTTIDMLLDILAQGGNGGGDGGGFWDIVTGGLGDIFGNNGNPQ